MTIADKEVPPNPEQGKPEQPWMKEAAKELAAIYEQARGFGTMASPYHDTLAEIIAKHYAASQPLVPQHNADACVVCGAYLLPKATEPPHCEDCQLTEEHQQEWEERNDAALVPQQEPTNHMERGDAEWQYLVTLANAIRSQLDSKPSRLKLGTWGCDPGSVLNAYREGDLNFKEAVSRLRAGVPSEQGTPPQGVIPMVQRATGRTIPDLTKLEHVCEYQARIGALPQSTNCLAGKCLETESLNGYPYCSLSEGHVGPHRAYESHNLDSTLLREWALPTPPSGEKT